MNPDNIDIVLVHTTHSGNIGGVARAMKNMGLHRMTLVSPLEFPAPEATWRAASAADVLGNARIVDTLEEAIADCQFVVGTSARERRIPWPVQDARRCAERIASHSSNERVAVLFGREDRGLLNEELERCHLHCHIPSHVAYASLNLAMAVQIVAYELRMAHLGEVTNLAQDAQWDTPFATAEDMDRFYEHLEFTLVDIEFLKPEAPRQLMRRLKRLYNRVRLDEMELNILRGILSETQKKARKSDR
ncbi:tRNA (cytosine(32)/uridine(32)-2'-O)-methyltransferase TrmJ [Luminiphilus sp.]|nr:tRNA (cytosine(32)/uridine(32)-2'-O)-methyltransferase TrmJ [Luminiphilus sp.]MDA9711773.1 tRNA (cytosine(32)/uridine(32)-2'-O)-methyltransferase TrmJ [Luminiphilus sp.]